MKKLLIFMIVSSGAFAQSAPAPKAGSGTEKSVSDAYTLLSSDRFLSPGGDKLSTVLGISKLNAIAHPIDHSKSNPKAHPALPHIVFDPMQMLPRIEVEYRKGDPSKAAYSARRIMQLCSECHAAESKPVWSSLAPTSSLSLIEWAEFYKLSLRYDDALLQYEKVLNSPGLASSQPAIWERAGMNVVALGIETSFNAYTFVGIVSNSLGVAKMNNNQRALLSSWRMTGKDWGKERGAPTQAFQQLTQAQQLVGMANAMNRSLPNSGFVHQARAMMVLKKVMQKGGIPQKARAFLMAGQIREKIALEGVWLHAEDYYEACIRIDPKGADAAKCLSALNGLSNRVPRYSMDPSSAGVLSKLMK